MAAKTSKQQENTTPAAEEKEKTVPEKQTDPEQQTDPDPDEEEEEEEEEKVLLAQTYILYNSHQYKPGDELPGNDPAMLEAWLEAGTAAWVSVSELISDTAIPVSALAGLYGSAVSSDSDDGENLVGRVPINAGRRRK